MIDDAPAHQDLQALGPAARRAVATAEAEALSLGHSRIGTEHLLLGVLTDETSAAARVLGEAGVLLPLARRKVREGLPASPRAANALGGPLELTARAARALGQSVRFSHGRRAGTVTTEHLLIGVLHVEGTAGQVLRSLGVDVEGLRVALDAVALDAGELRATDDAGPPVGDHERPVVKSLLCPACGVTVDGTLVHRTVSARGEQGTREVGVLSCGGCGTIVGVVPS